MNTFLTLLLFSFGTPVLAGSGFIGNGGFGVVKGDRIFLTDLDEAGLSEAIYVLGKVATREDFEFPELDRLFTFPPRTIAAVLQKIDDRNPGMGWLLARSIAAMKWRTVQRELGPTNDLGDWKNPSQLPVRQLAVRTGDRVELAESLLVQMPPVHQIALIIHEALFPLFKWTCDWIIGDCVRSRSEKIRSLTRKLLFQIETLDSMDLANFDIQAAIAGSNDLNVFAVLRIEGEGIAELYERGLNLMTPSGRTSFAEDTCGPRVPERFKLHFYARRPAIDLRWRVEPYAISEMATLTPKEQTIVCRSQLFVSKRDCVSSMTALLESCFAPTPPRR